MLKSKIVSSPAGSGKTQKLAERYIELLQQNIPPERILTITFTEKAAAEMKERIFQLLREKDLKMYQILKEKSLSLRIQTIDSFCLSLLKRFAVNIGLQPDLEVLADPKAIWTDSVYDTLMTIAEKEKGTSDYEQLLNSIVPNKFRGWPNLKKLFDSLFEKRQSIERGKIPSYQYAYLESLVSQIKNHPITSQKIPDFPIRAPKEDFSDIDDIRKDLESIKHTFLTQKNCPSSDICHPEIHEWYQLMFQYWRIILTVVSNQRFSVIFDLFIKRFLGEYNNRKKVLRQVDFNDLELLTYRVLTEHPEWSNILYIFDEHTDHILVDEFQDTSFLQWAIITKLAEEWLSGLGAKRERGIKPTIFLVGDDKQSIYLFRNAHSEIFEKAKSYLTSRLKSDELEIVEDTDNYRSLSSIIDFTNLVFPKIMTANKDAPPWQTRYRHFVRKRNNPNPGIVQIILDTAEGKMANLRQIDAELVALKILDIINKPIVFDIQENARPCRFEDIAILLRRRTHLTRYENALRKYNIPFVIVKGAGFYDSPEIAILISLVNFLSDPTRNYDLYVVLKSPLFALSEKELLLINEDLQCDLCVTEKDTLFTSTNSDLKISLWTRFKNNAKTSARYQDVISKLTNWISQIGYRPMVEILEEILDIQNGWKTFWQPQQVVNIKKFLKIVEDLENNGSHPLAICDYFEKNKDQEESKANVNTEGRNEVKLMTIHSAKGLQFPVVFFVGLDEKFENHRKNESAYLLINEVSESEVWVSYEPDSNLRKLSPLFDEYKSKELEEEKRIFYVGVTRARDALFLTGVYNPKSSQKESRLNWLINALDIRLIEDNKLSCNVDNIPGFSIISVNELKQTIKNIKVQLSDDNQASQTQPVTLLEPIIEEPEYHWRAVTKELTEIESRVRQNYGEHWIILGDILHKIFEKISQGKIRYTIEDIETEAVSQFLIHNIPKSNQPAMLDEIKKQFETILNSEILSLIQPQNNSYAELPFVLKENKIVYSGRIDRVIIKDSVVNIYDYKTFPISETEISDLIQKYLPQLKIYQKAVSKIFSVSKTKSYLVFTQLGKIIPCS
ncbi:MAG: UvrD-helicase domain-containing protein [candidate division WOR-3 bacterium]